MSQKRPGEENEVRARFWFGEWRKEGTPRGDLATREEIMMAMEDLKSLLVKYVREESYKAGGPFDLLPRTDADAGGNMRECMHAWQNSKQNLGL